MPVTHGGVVGGLVAEALEPVVRRLNAVEGLELLLHGLPSPYWGQEHVVTGLLTGADLVDGEAQVFATNVAEIIVEAGNPRGITGIADLAHDDLVIVQCAPAVPCGAYAEQVLAAAGVAVTPSSLEQNVKAVATKVLLGEADAGIVYRTDVLAAVLHLPGGVWRMIRALVRSPHGNRTFIHTPHSAPPSAGSPVERPRSQAHSGATA